MIKVIARRGEPIQMNTFLRPNLVGGRISETYPKKKLDKAITIFPTAFPAPVTKGSR